jgi:photolyase PhrII
VQPSYLSGPESVRFDFLPTALRERTVPLGPGTPRTGDYVVYWMRNALRARENPALDVALLAGRQLGKPVFIYQGLSERYAYASDRHHTFILEGARDVAQQLADRGIGYAFHLERPGHRRAQLRSIAAAAALVVTEDVPVAPFAAVEGFSGWDAEVAKVAPLWRVDTACVVPFRAVRARPSRAEAFRAEREARWDEALRTAWEEVEPGPLFLPQLEFEPLKLGEVSIEACVAECDIDHAVAPARQLPGGTASGRRRWAEFVEGSLAEYSQARGNPLDARGHSRLSAYLHYGMLSVFEIAREARARGAEKFLEELLVWRELAWAWCALEPRHATVAALPEWARTTLERHRGDARVLHSYETLCRAQTEDAGWDAAQRSLLTRGELHNTVRMSWGKAVVGWSRDAATAMKVLIDLNHRFALDGRDPSSYLGVSYCLGAFDRPFSPEVPVLGAVRPRSTARFDVSEYSRRTRRPARGQPLTVAVVGAGVSGAACARALVDAGQQVTVFDEGTQAGGRCVASPDFQARHRQWLRWVRAWVDEGTAAPWRDGFVGTPTMSSVVKRMLHAVDVRLEVRVASVERHGERWRLVAESGAGLGEFEAVVVAIPPAKAIGLMKWSAPALAALAEQAVMAPQWVLRLALSEALDLEESMEVRVGPLARLVRESHPPGRAGGERWLIHATPAWSGKHLDDPAEKVSLALLDAFWATTGARREQPSALEAELWREARVEAQLGVSCLFDSELRIAAAGDWCGGRNGEGREPTGACFEAAFLSGVAAAGRLNALLGEAQQPEPSTLPGQLKLF